MIGRDYTSRRVGRVVSVKFWAYGGPFVLGIVGIVATLAIAVGVAFIFSKTVPSMPNKVCRFVFLLALWVPLNLVFNYVNVWAFGYHRMSWTGAIIIAVLLAAYGTFVPPQPHDPKTQ